MLCGGGGLGLGEGTAELMGQVHGVVHCMVGRRYVHMLRITVDCGMDLLLLAVLAAETTCSLRQHMLSRL